jgi:hypothetical protein
MLLTAAVTKAEIETLALALTPLRLAIDERRGRVITLGRPRLELVPNRGIRLRGDARITWDVAGVTVPITLQAWQLLLVPRVVASEQGAALELDPLIEALDLKGLPSFLDDKIVRTIRDAIAQNRHRLAWNFARALSKRWPLPARIGAGAFSLVAIDAAAGVSAEDVKLTLRFAPAIERVESVPRSLRSPTSERRPEIR